MNYRRLLLAVALICLLVPLAQAQALEPPPPEAQGVAVSAMRTGALRCEYADNPVGIRTLSPRLSWTLVDDERGQQQTAYQIRVATTPEALTRGNGGVMKRCFSRD